jgi:GT2 family glycosyltransferase
MTAAIGLVTYNRPRFADKSIRALERSVRPLDCVLSACNDGSDPKYLGEYKRAYKRAPKMTVIECPENRGVAAAKNTLLRWMLDTTDAEWLFLLEDDILITSPMAVVGYIEAAEAYGMHHLSFAHHGPANAEGPVAREGAIEFYPHSIGAWTMFSRECLESVGLFDENFHNAWEHVEHEMRLIAAGFMPGAAAHRFPDVKDSALWLDELPNAITESAIRPRGDWQSSIVSGLRYWREAKPETFEMLFGAGTPLEGYAASLLSE